MNTLSEAPTGTDQTDTLIKQAREEGVAEGIKKGRKSLAHDIWFAILLVVLGIAAFILGLAIIDHFDRERTQDDRISNLESDAEFYNSFTMSYDDKNFVCKASGKDYYPIEDECAYPMYSDSGIPETTFPKDPIPTTPLPPIMTAREFCEWNDGMWYEPDISNNFYGECYYGK